jgi:hypothetical protein
MLGRGLLGAVASAAVVAASPASAAPVPPPTVRILTTVAGMALPVSTFSGSWQVSRPGRTAKLDISGVAPPASKTTVHAEWTSTWRRIGAGQKGVRLDLADTATVLLAGNPDAVGSLHVFLRRPHGKWLPLGAGVYEVTYPLLSNDSAGTTTIVYLEKTARVQWRVDLDITIADTARHTVSAKLTAY